MTPRVPSARGSRVGRSAARPAWLSPCPACSACCPSHSSRRAGENLLHGFDVDAEEIGERLEVRRERHDRADVQIAVGPAVQPLADAWRERVVDGRVTKRALDAHRLDAAVGLAKAVTPTTAFSFSSAIVVAGSSRLTLPALICVFKASGSASASTLRPTDSAVFGETPGPTPPFFSPAMALCSWSASPQKASLPNVS